jgi:hypothetical protein
MYRGNGNSFPKETATLSACYNTPYNYNYNNNNNNNNNYYYYYSNNNDIII